MAEYREAMHDICGRLAAAVRMHGCGPGRSLPASENLFTVAAGTVGTVLVAARKRYKFRVLSGFIVNIVTSIAQ